MTKDDRPRCRLCRRPVDNCHGGYDAARNQWVYEIACHGAVERASVDEGEPRRHRRGAYVIAPDVAFPADIWAVRAAWAVRYTPRAHQ